MATVEDLGDPAIEIPDVDAAVGGAGVDVLLAREVLGREVAADESSDDRVTAVDLATATRSGIKVRSLGHRRS